MKLRIFQIISFIFLVPLAISILVIISGSERSPLTRIYAKTFGGGICWIAKKACRYSTRSSLHFACLSNDDCVAANFNCFESSCEGDTLVAARSTIANERVREVESMSEFAKRACQPVLDYSDQRFQVACLRRAAIPECRAGLCVNAVVDAPVPVVP